MSESHSPLFHQCAAVIVDDETVRVLSPLNDVDALALQGCSADDPANWNDVAMVWQRYKFHPENTEFADALPFRLTNMDEAIDSLADAPVWFALDLIQRRVITGGEFPLLRLRCTPIDEDGPMTQTTVLPPWWELLQHVDPVVLRSKRETALNTPDPRRDVLWGSAMTNFFAAQMLRAIREGKQWIGENWEGSPCGSHEITLEVHRDWLMTPCDDLGGGIPRDRLHGGMEWIDDLAGGQTFRVYQGEDPVPIPMELSTYETAAIGRHEVVLYFEACRETIEAGWQWLLDDKRRIDDVAAGKNLADAMNQFLTDWLESPFEGGRPPAEVIRCDRIRIPLVNDGGSHVIDCDCPICEMMASGMFGPSIAHFDGHALELDDEFAFSMHSTREAWEAQQREWEEMNARIEADRKRREESGETDEDAFPSVWHGGSISDEGIPGDSFGHLGMAFLVAELVSSLKFAEADQADIDQLNAAFRQYRNASLPDEVIASAESFKQTLEQLAAKHAELVNRAADLQSRIDERLRTPTVDGPDFDVPF
jgi:hypothetical protein